MTTRIFSTPAQESPCLLGHEQMEEPLDVLREHFSRYSLADHRHITWSVLSAAIGCDVDQCYDASDIGKWVQYLRELDLLLEAAWLMQSK